ncbi:extracellular solute-binding protein [Actinoplanes sp. NPDC051494]|uniref:extracellular solute-binding protein n=1 Tax=Actinoplanes sp. NPDC051494 TaxID=3363907 RepID=UPI0037B07146
MRRRLVLAGAAVTALGLLAGCGGSGGDADSGTTLNVAALEGGYGRDMYTEVIAAYQAKNPGVEVNLQISKSIEDEISPNMKAGKFPDVVVLGQGRKAALTETLIKDKALENLTPVLSTKVPGEDRTVADKLTEGIVGNLMPMYYSPTGLFYNKGLFAEKGFTVPATWDDMFALGDKAKAQGIALFTYPVQPAGADVRAPALGRPDRCVGHVRDRHRRHRPRQVRDRVRQHHHHEAAGGADRSDRHGGLHPVAHRDRRVQLLRAGGGATAGPCHPFPLTLLRRCRRGPG